MSHLMVLVLDSAWLVLFLSKPLPGIRAIRSEWADLFTNR